MSRRWYVETTPSGRQQFVTTIKRSRSYGGHRTREVDYVKVRLDEWNDLVDKETQLRDVNKAVLDECSALKAESKRLGRQVDVLSADNEALRRSPSSSSAAAAAAGEQDRLRRKAAKLEKENDGLRDDNAHLLDKNRSLSRQLEQGFGGGGGRRVSELMVDVDYWKQQYSSCKSKYEGLLKRYDELCDRLEARTKKMRAYEDILQRRGII